MMKTKPIHEVRLGCIKAAIWRNQTDMGVRYNASFSRLYRDGGQWRVTESFGRDDLLLLAKVADQAHSWIMATNQSQENGIRIGGAQGGDANGNSAGSDPAVSGNPIPRVES